MARAFVTTLSRFYQRGRMNAPKAELSVVTARCVAPLSLMVDQVSSLQCRGISSAILSGTQGLTQEVPCPR